MVNETMKTTASSLGLNTLNDTAPIAVATSDTYRLEVDEAALELERSSMDESPSILTISSMKHEDLPALNPGMTNVTKGPRKGYRFGPHPKKFKKHIKVELPFDKSKLPSGMSEEDIKTR